MYNSFITSLWNLSSKCNCSSMIPSFMIPLLEFWCSNTSAEMIFSPLELHVLFSFFLKIYLHSPPVMESILKDHAMFYVGECLFQWVVNCNEIFLNHSYGQFWCFLLSFVYICIPSNSGSGHFFLLLFISCVWWTLW